MNKYHEALDRLQWEENFQKGNEIEILREIVEQYRPPTFDEVVKAWEEVESSLTAMWYRNEFVVYETNDDDEWWFIYDCETNEYTFDCSSIEMLNAINLTIRYLQAKEKE